jgi:hypothetical protein
MAKFKVGDKIKCIDNHNALEVNVGQEYKVLGYHSFLNGLVQLECGRYLDEKRFELVEVTHYNFQVVNV